MSVLFYGNCEISLIPVINRPSFGMCNDGVISFMQILYPRDEFKSTHDAVREAVKFESENDLIKHFVIAENIAYNDLHRHSHTEIIKVNFMGFDWNFLHDYKEIIGSVPDGYAFMPLIARWYVLTNKSISLNKSNVDFLPLGYKGGTGNGFNITPKMMDIEVGALTPLLIASSKMYGE